MDIISDIIKIKDAANANTPFRVKRITPDLKIEIEGYTKTLALAAVITIEDAKSIFNITPNDPAYIELKQKTLEHYNTYLLNKDIHIEFLSDSYYDNKYKKGMQSHIYCLVYVNYNGHVLFNENIIKNGYGVYNNHESEYTYNYYPNKGSSLVVGRVLHDTLREAELKSIQDAKGIWDRTNKSQYSFIRSLIVEKYRKTEAINDQALKRELKELDRKKERIPKNASRAKRRADFIESVKTNSNRSYSKTKVGEDLEKFAPYYFPQQSSLEIIKGIVTKQYSSSLIQIGALWIGHPTALQEQKAEGSSAHPSSISEVRKDGDVESIMGSGFLSMISGDKPPLEGITIEIIVEPNGIETTLVPLVYQLRMDPIIPIRNLHLNRYLRPIYSNASFYSEVFGKIPDDISKLVGLTADIIETQDDSKVALRSALDLLYLSVPIYVAVQNISVRNIERSDGSFLVTINATATDVTDKYGKYPEYFKTIEDAFETNKLRSKIIDRIDTTEAVTHILDQLNYNIERDSLNINQDKSQSNYSIKSIPIYKEDDLESIIVLRDNKLIEIPKTVKVGHARLSSKHKNDYKHIIEDVIIYKPALGLVENSNFITNTLAYPITNVIPEKVISHYNEWAANSMAPPLPISIGSNNIIRTSNKQSDYFTNKNSILSLVLSEYKNHINEKNLFGVSSKSLNELLNMVYGLSKNISYYPRNYKNYDTNELCGLKKPIINAFELIGLVDFNTSNEEDSDTNYNISANNLMFEFAISYLMESAVVQTLNDDIVIDINNYNSPVISGSFESGKKNASLVDFSYLGNDDSPSFKSPSFSSLTMSEQKTLIPYEKLYTSLKNYNITSSNINISRESTQDYIFGVDQNDYPKNKLSINEEVWKLYKNKDPILININYTENTKLITTAIKVHNVIISNKGTKAVYCKTNNNKTLLLLSKDHIETISDLIHSYRTSKNNSEQINIITQIKTLITATINKKDPLDIDVQSNDAALKNIYQILNRVKSKNGTHFLDESEPYVFSVMYQMGKIWSDQYEMTYKSRPDRIPFWKPSPDEQTADYNTMVINIRREDTLSEDKRTLSSFRVAQVIEEELLKYNLSNDDEMTEFVNTYVNMYCGHTTTNNCKEMSESYYLGMLLMLSNLLEYTLLLHFTATAGMYYYPKIDKISSKEGKQVVGLLDSSVMRKLQGEKKKILTIIHNKKGELKKLSLQKLLIQQGLKELENFEKIVDATYNQIETFKTPNGDSFVSVSSIKRVLAYTPSGYGSDNAYSSSTSLIDSIFNNYMKIQKSMSTNDLKTSFNVDITNNTFKFVDQSLASSIKSLLIAMKENVEYTRAIRFATGIDLGLRRNKRMIVKNPIPVIFFQEEYGISTPLMKSGQSKPSHQVIGTPISTAAINFSLNIDDFYLDGNTSLKDIMSEEEGIDALYNIVHERSSVSEQVNMLKVGRAISRKKSTYGRNGTVSQTDIDSSTKDTYRLIRKASIDNMINSTALLSLSGINESFLDIREPLLLSLGLYKFTSKSTYVKTKDSENVLGWDIGLELLPYEAGYTSNKNLREKFNPISESMLGNVSSFLGAVYNRGEILSLMNKSTKDLQNVPSTSKIASVTNRDAMFKKVVANAGAQSTHFASMVIMYAIHKAYMIATTGDGLSYSEELMGFINNSSNSSNLPETVTMEITNKGLRDSLLNDIMINQHDNLTSIDSFHHLSSVSLLSVSGGIIAGIGSQALLSKWIPKFVTQNKVISKLAGVAFTSIGFIVDMTVGILVDRFIHPETMKTSITDLQENLGLDKKYIVPVSIVDRFQDYALQFLDAFIDKESKGEGIQFIDEISKNAKAVIDNLDIVTGLKVLNSGDIEIGSDSGSVIGVLASVFSLPTTLVTNDGYNPTDKNGVAIIITNAHPSVDTISTGIGAQEHYKDSMEDMFEDYYEHKSEKKDLFTTIDYIGEELITFLTEAQHSVFSVDIYNIATYPYAVNDNALLYYNMTRGLLGRLRLDVMGYYMLSPEKINQDSMKAQIILDHKKANNSDSPLKVTIIDDSKYVNIDDRYNFIDKFGELQEYSEYIAPLLDDTILHYPGDGLRKLFKIIRTIGLEIYPNTESVDVSTSLQVLYTYIKNIYVIDKKIPLPETYYDLYDKFIHEGKLPNKEIHQKIFNRYAYWLIVYAKDLYNSINESTINKTLKHYIITQDIIELAGKKVSDELSITHEDGINYIISKNEELIKAIQDGGIATKSTMFDKSDVVVNDILKDIICDLVLYSESNSNTKLYTLQEYRKLIKSVRDIYYNSSQFLDDSKTVNSYYNVTNGADIITNDKISKLRSHIFEYVHTDAQSYNKYQIFKVSYLNIFFNVTYPEYVPYICYTISQDEINVESSMLIGFYNEKTMSMLLQYNEFSILRSLRSGIFGLSNTLLSFDTLIATVGSSVGITLLIAGLGISFGLPVVLVGAIVLIVLLATKFIYLQIEKNNITFQQQLFKTMRRSIKTTDDQELMIHIGFLAVKIAIDLLKNINEAEIIFYQDILHDALTLPSPSSPDILDSIYSNEFIVNDNMIYINLPLIKKKAISHISDVLTPGGYIKPDYTLLGSHKDAMQNITDLNNSVMESYLDDLPDRFKIEIDTVRGLGIGQNRNIKLVPDRNTTDHNSYIKANEFIHKMSRVFSVSSKKTEYKITEHTNHYIIPALVGGINSLISTLFSNLKTTKTNEALKIRYLIALNMLLEIDITDTNLKNSILGSSKTLKNTTIEANFKTAKIIFNDWRDRLIILQEITNNNKLINNISIGKRNKYIAYSYLINYLLTDNASYLFNTSGCNTTLSFYMMPTSNSVTKVSDKLILNVDTTKKIIGNSRDDSAFRTDIGIIREMANNSTINSEYMEVYTRSLPLDDDGILCLSEQSISLTKGITDSLLFIDNHDLNNEKLIQDNEKLYNYINSATKVIELLSGYTGSITINNNINLDFVTKLIAINEFDRLKRDVKQEHKAIVVPNKTFVNLIKNSSIASIINAFQQIAGFIHYIDYQYKQYILIGKDSNRSNNSLLWSNKTGPIFIDKDEISDLEKSNTANNIEDIAVDNLKQGLISSYILSKKLDELLDSQSSQKIETEGRVGKEVRNILMNPIKSYPVVKLYFIEKDSEGLILYDDLYSYADIISVKIYETTKSPGSYVEIQLADTENKLDNILTARNDSENPFETKALYTDPLSGILLKAGTRMAIYTGYGNILTEEELFLCEIENVSKDQSNMVTIYARGPGWVLNGQLYESNSEYSKIVIDETDINTIYSNDNGIDNDIEDILLPEESLAKSIILQGLVKGGLTNLDRLNDYFEQGAEINNIVSDDAFNIYANLTKGIYIPSMNISTMSTYIKTNISKLIFPVFNHTSLDFGQSIITDEKYSNQQYSTFSKNILLSPLIVGESSAISANYIIPILRDWSNYVIEFGTEDYQKGRDWIIDKESYWMFLKEVLLNVPSAVVTVRSYNKTGSIVIGKKDTYYSMYSSKTIISRFINNAINEIRSKISGGDGTFIVEYIQNLINNHDTPAKREMLSQILTTVIGSLSMMGTIQGEKLVSSINNLMETNIEITNSNVSGVQQLYNMLTQKYIMNTFIPDSKTIQSPIDNNINMLTMEEVDKLISEYETKYEY